MNRSIARLFILIVLLFGTLVGFTSYWVVIDAKGLTDNVANRRPLLEEQRIRRGLILASDGAVLARNIAHGRGNDVIYSRYYPKGSLFGHPVGYSFVDKGRVELERRYNSPLVGKRDEFTNIIDELLSRPPDGDNLRLTLAPNAQRTALDALGDQRGAVVALDPRTGAVRVLASNPPYDPNLVPKEFGRLVHDPASPLLDRAVQSGYPPGSTLKVVTAAAALDSGKYSPDSIVNGDSPKVISGVPLSNFGGTSYGSISLTDALTNSVNTVWAQVGDSLGKDVMFEYMDRFGFNRKPPIDLLPGEMTASGVYEGDNLLSQADAVDIGRVAIGQERLRVTPLQMAMVVGAVANGGKLMTPHLGDKIIDPDGRTVDEIKPKTEARAVSQQTADRLALMMSKVVEEGTGTAAALRGVSVAGKTGTAEIANGTANDAWFIGFAPVESPRVAVAVVVENTSGQGGTVAAPIAKQVMESLL